MKRMVRRQRLSAIRASISKAREIHRTLGTHVPVPEESESVTEAVLNALFLRGRKTNTDQLQLDLGLEAPQVSSLHARWERDAERERTNRTRFAQRALKPIAADHGLVAARALLAPSAGPSTAALRRSACFCIHRWRHMRRTPVAC
jgi:hypothetical protein